MIIEKVGNDGRTQLMIALNKLTSSLVKRNVSFVINTHSEFVGTINLIVTGKLGSAQKTIVIIYNHTSGEWEGYSDGYLFRMLLLNELSTVLKSKINKLSVLLHKV